MNIKLLSITSVMASTAGVAQADTFNRIASFPTSLNNADVSAESSAEIISVTSDGITLVYSDSPLGVIGLVDITDPSTPALAQLRPSGIAPEGAVAVPSRNLFVTANVADLIEDGSHVMIYELQDAATAYPQLTSAGAGKLIGCGAICGMMADADGIIWAVNDSSGETYFWSPGAF